MSRYTRVVYQEVAEILRRNYPYNPEHLTIWLDIRYDFEYSFRIDNSYFDAYKFRDACMPAGRLEASNVS